MHCELCGKFWADHSACPECDTAPSYNGTGDDMTDDAAPSLTIPCPDCGTPFDLRNDNFWNEVRDHTCTKILPPMEYLQWEPDYKYDDETEESTFRAWHLFPDSWSAPQEIKNAGCHACITPYHGRHTVRLERQGEFIADFLNIDTAKSYVERKINDGAWPMPKLY